MVALAADDEGELGAVVGVETLAGGADGGDLLDNNLSELALGHAVAVEDDACRLLLGQLVKVLEQLLRRSDHARRSTNAR